MPGGGVRPTRARVPRGIRLVRPTACGWLAAMANPGYDGMWLPTDQDPRMQMGPTRGERECLIGYLEHYRQTLALKCDGLTAEQLATRAVPPSNISLLGLVRHMARVEQSWFRRVIEARMDIPRLFQDEAEDAGLHLPRRRRRPRPRQPRSLAVGDRLRPRGARAHRPRRRRRRARRAQRGAGHRGAHDRGVRPPLRARRPRPRVHRRARRPVGRHPGGWGDLRRLCG